MAAAVVLDSPQEAGHQHLLQRRLLLLLLLPLSPTRCTCWQAQAPPIVLSLPLLLPLLVLLLGLLLEVLYPILLLASLH